MSESYTRLLAAAPGRSPTWLEEFPVLCVVQGQQEPLQVQDIVDYEVCQAQGVRLGPNYMKQHRCWNGGAQDVAEQVQGRLIALVVQQSEAVSAQ